MSEVWSVTLGGDLLKGQVFGSLTQTCAVWGCGGLAVIAALQRLRQLDPMNSVAKGNVLLGDLKVQK